MLYLRPSLRFFSVLCLSLFLTACANTPVSEPKQLLNLNIVSDAGSNPDYTGRPSPTVVKVFQLKSDGKFKQNKFIDIFQDDSVLSTDNLESKEIVVSPNDQTDLMLALHKDTQYIGVIAAFQQSNNAKYKLVMPIPELSEDKITEKIRKLVLLPSPAEASKLSVKLQQNQLILNW